MTTTADSPSTVNSELTSTPVVKRKIDDIKSPLSTDNDSIIILQSSQISPDRKIRLLGNDNVDIKNGSNKDTVADGGSRSASVTSPVEEPKQRRGSKRIQPSRVKKIYKAKRLITTQNKREKKSKPQLVYNKIPSPETSKEVTSQQTPLTLQDLEQCFENGFEKLKKEFASKSEVEKSLDFLSCQLKNDVAVVYEQVQSNAVSINDQSKELVNLKDEQNTQSAKISLLEGEHKSDYQFVTNKLNKLTATVSNIKKQVDRPNASMQTVKLTESNQKLKEEVESLQVKFKESQVEVVKLHEKMETLKLGLEKVKSDAAAPVPPFRAQTNQNNQTVMPEETQRSKCIIIEGVTEDPNFNLYDMAIEMMDEMGITLMYWEINYIERVGKFDPNKKWPRPIKLSLVSDWKRDLLLECKDKLFYTEHYYRVTIKQDEPRHIRVAKAKLRQATNKARTLGAIVRKANDGVYLNGVKYTVDNVDSIPERFTATQRIPDKYKGRNQKVYAHPSNLTRENVKAHTSTGGNNDQQNDENDENMDTTPSIEKVGDWLEPGIRKIKDGLAFFTFRAYMSNFHEAPFTLNNENHKTGEHGLQMEKAWFHRDYNAVTAIRKASTPAEAKAIGGGITSLPEWNEYKYIAADKVSYARYTQNPELCERLCATGSCKLVEASPDTDWGIGVSIWDDQITDGEGEGENNFGKSTARVRARLQKERSKGNSTEAK